MDNSLVARTGLSLLCILQGIGTVAVDSNRTHATNPLWTGHARFHVVWQICTVCLVSLLEVILVWALQPGNGWSFYLAALLAATSPVAFLATFFLRRTFSGTLSDPNGIPPFRLNLFGAIRSIDGNLAVVVVFLVSLVAIIWIYRS